MACALCESNKKRGGYINANAQTFPPYKTTDINVYENGLVRRMDESDWNPSRHKLLLFYPETNTPVCASEMGAVNNWIDKFDELDCDVYSITTDPIGMVKQWYEENEDLKDPKYKALSSFMLTSRMGLLYNERAKRASVFITKEGDVVTQEHFLKVGRSLSELHRMMFAYTTGSYCAEGWHDPSDGFLSDNN